MELNINLVSEDTVIKLSALNVIEAYHAELHYKVVTGGDVDSEYIYKDDIIIPCENGLLIIRGDSEGYLVFNSDTISYAADILIHPLPDNIRLELNILAS